MLSPMAEDNTVEMNLSRRLSAAESSIEELSVMLSKMSNLQTQKLVGSVVRLSLLSMPAGVTRVGP